LEDRLKLPAFNCHSSAESVEEEGSSPSGASPPVIHQSALTMELAAKALPRFKGVT